VFGFFPGLIKNDLHSLKEKDQMPANRGHVHPHHSKRVYGLPGKLHPLLPAVSGGLFVPGVSRQSCPYFGYRWHEPGKSVSFLRQDTHLPDCLKKIDSLHEANIEAAAKSGKDKKKARLPGLLNLNSFKFI